MRGDFFKLVLVILLVIFCGCLFLVHVRAESAASAGIVVTAPSGINLNQITLPSFVDLTFVNNFSIVSYFALGLNLVFIGIVLLWIFIIVRAAVKVITAGASDEPLQEAKKKVGNVALSAAILIGFLAVLTIVANFLGLGNFWQWPKSFSICNDGRYYYTVLLESGDVKVADTNCFK
jgi:hypothetical protein